jgi:hypothetical protein
MSVVSKIKDWWRDRREGRGRRRGDRSLREFVYLDEVSVYSLIASRRGAVPAEVTETESALLRGEVNSSVAASAAVAKAEVGSSFETQQRSGSQVVRKALVQSTFKELFDLEAESLPLRAARPSGTPPAPGDAQKLLELAQSGSSPWVLLDNALDRGTLLELEVELEAEGIFRMSAIMTSFFEIVDQNPKLLGSVSIPNVLDGLMVNQMLERLLVGLVPIRGRAVHYRYVRVGSEGLIVHRELLDQMADPDLPVQPLFVVGVAERELFWRDIRRVLFSRSRYSVLCRLSGGGTQDSWTPVKLVDVLKEVSPDLGSSVQEAGGFLDRQKQAEQRSVDEATREEAMREALTVYALDLTRQYGHPSSVEELGDLGLPSESQSESHATIMDRRAAFRELTGRLEEDLGFEAEPLTMAQLREAALSGVGFDLEGNLALRPGTDQELVLTEEVPRYLDSNIVAIYW